MIDVTLERNGRPEYISELAEQAQSRHEWSQRRLAEAMGVSRHTLLNWLHRTNKPTLIPFSAQLLLEHFAGRRTITKLKD